MDKENYQKIIANLIGSKLIAFNRDISEFLGNDITCALFVNQLLYWWQKGKYPDKIFKKDSEFYEECGLTERICRRARKKLKALGWIDYKKEGIPPITHYYIFFEKIADDLTKWMEIKKNNPNQKSHYKKLDTNLTKSQESILQNSRNIPENTTKNTTENTSCNFSEEKLQSFNNENVVKDDNDFSPLATKKNKEITDETAVQIGDLDPNYENNNEENRERERASASASPSAPAPAPLPASPLTSTPQKNRIGFCIPEELQKQEKAEKKTKKNKKKTEKSEEDQRITQRFKRYCAIYDEVYKQYFKHPFPRLPRDLKALKDIAKTTDIDSEFFKEMCEYFFSATEYFYRDKSPWTMKQKLSTLIADTQKQIDEDEARFREIELRERERR